MKLQSAIPHAGSRRRGFTLVEILVAMFVLALILVMLAEIFKGTVTATSASQKQLEATREARTVLDTLREDLANLVVENNLATVFVSPDGSNSKLLFVTRRRGPQSISNLRFLVVSYELRGTDLYRNVSQISWTDADFVTRVFQTPTPSMSGVLAKGILRFEVMPQLTGGNVVSLSEAGSWKSTQWNGTALPGNYSAFYLKSAPAAGVSERVRGLTVAVAVLHESCLKLPNASGIAGALTVSSSGKTPQETWMGIINGGGLAGYSLPAVAALRVAQATYSLP